GPAPHLGPPFHAASFVIPCGVSFALDTPGAAPARVVAHNQGNHRCYCFRPGSISCLEDPFTLRKCAATASICDFPTKTIGSPTQCKSADHGSSRSPSAPAQPNSCHLCMLRQIEVCNSEPVQPTVVRRLSPNPYRNAWQSGTLTVI